MNALALASPDVAGATSILHVVFKVADTDYALPVDVVLQMETYAGATHVPGAPPFVAGVIQVRGRVVPVIDLRVRFGLPRAERDPNARVVVGLHGDRAVALVTDSAREVVKIGPDQVKPPPALLGGVQGFVKGTAHVGPRMILILDFAKIISEESLDGVQR